MFSKKGKQVPFEKGTRKGKGSIPDKPDRPESNKEKQARRSEIESNFQEQFALRDENEREYAKFKILIAELSINGDKKNRLELLVEQVLSNIKHLNDVLCIIR